MGNGERWRTRRASEALSPPTGRGNRTIRMNLLHGVRDRRVAEENGGR